MQHQRAFTLLELMIVVSVIGVLAALAGPNLSGWRTMIRVKGEAREIAALIKLGRARAKEEQTRHMLVISRGNAAIASDDRAALFGNVPSANYVVTSLTADQMDGKAPPPGTLSFAGAVDVDAMSKASEVGFGIGVVRTFPYPYTTVSTATACSFCSAMWGVIFFETTGELVFSSGSALLTPQPQFGALTVSPVSEWSGPLKNYYTVIVSQKTGATSVWNSSDK